MDEVRAVRGARHREKQKCNDVKIGSHWENKEGVSGNRNEIRLNCRSRYKVV
jgi:hypothetical protein